MELYIKEMKNYLSSDTCSCGRFLANQFRLFLMTGSADRELALDNQRKATQAALESNDALFNRYFPKEMRTLKDALSAYFASLDVYKHSLQTMKDIDPRLAEQATALRSKTAELQQNQIAARDDDSTRARLLQTSGALGAIVLGLLAALLISRQITQPLQETLDIARRIADGDLTSETRVTRRDELGVLQKGILDMAGTLRALIGGIRDSATQIASAAEELSVVTEQTSTGVHKQKEETDQVATAMHEMSATVQDVASNAASAAHAAEKADTEAERGQQVVAESVQVIDSLAREVERAAQVIGELEDASATISSVVDVIRGIAEQTNLLALNAAIEAARAGEAGRGFAVVADEVRSLASRTQQSTEDIRAMIEKVQDGARRAVEVMEKSCTKAEAGREQLAETSAVLAQITAAVATINDMNAMIASAAEEQSSVAEEINRNITNVSEIAEDTSEASRQNVETSQALSGLAKHLHALVQKFKL